MRTVYKDLPISIKGFVVHDELEGCDTIVLNPAYSYESQLETCLHEGRHVLRDDFKKPVDMAEGETG